MTTDRLTGLLTVWWAARARWRTGRTEPVRVAMRAAWSITSPHPRAPPFDANEITTALAAATSTHCRATALSVDVDDEIVWYGAPTSKSTATHTPPM